MALNYNTNHVALKRHATEVDYKIRNMKPGELQIAIDWAASEGWNPGLNDAESFFQADPNGFFVGTLENELIAVCSGVLYQRAFGFIGLFIVHPDHRGLGYGQQLLHDVLQYTQHANVGLDGVPQMQSTYEHMGFRTAHRNFRFQGVCAGQSESGVVDLALVPDSKLQKFDRRYFPANRVNFLRSWTQQPEHLALGYVHNGRLQGYGVMRPCHVGYKIGPLFAETPEIAESLFSSFCSKTSGHPVTLDVPEFNDAAVRLARQHGMEQVFETARMYSRGIPKIDLDGVFGITTFELG